MANKGWAERHFGAWVAGQQLGSGGQGTVYRATRASAIDSRQRLRDEVTFVLQRGLELGRKLAAAPAEDFRFAAEAAEKILSNAVRWGIPEATENVGALKDYAIPPGPDGDNARARFAAELHGLRECAEAPGVLKLLDAEHDDGWMVTELHERGALDRRLDLFQGDALGALRAIRPVVQAVAHLHKLRIVHRDIKTANLFVADDGRLVLGDFGIVFYEDPQHTRVTEEAEKVGTREWMPPWVHTGYRLDTVPQNFDVFALGKVLWTMIAGRPFLPYWYWSATQNNLAELFDDPSMELVNKLVLARCVVERPGDCLQTGVDLLTAVDETIAAIEVGATALSLTARPRCRVCGRGVYVAWDNVRRFVVGAIDRPPHDLTVQIRKCTMCGHLEFFHFAEGKHPPAWSD